MTDKLKITTGNPYPLGVTRYCSKINFAAVFNTKEECGIILYTNNHTKHEMKIPFTQEHKVGNIYCFLIEGIEERNFSYNFYVGEDNVVDPYAKRIIGNEVWGKSKNKKLRAAYVYEEYNWENDKPLRIPYEDSIIYGIHVRGFTKHASSKSEYKGTFLGIADKIDYLKEIGITAIELMPCYEFEETEVEKKELPINENVKPFLSENIEETKVSINYWGFKKGYYFAPKASYAATDQPSEELKNLIKEMHKNNIEVIMQFYFPDEIKQGFILEVIKYWVLNYHIDGIHIKGSKVPFTLLATEPLFANTKIIHAYVESDEIYSQKEKPAYRNLAKENDEFMYDMRKFLKGDEDMLYKVTEHMRKNPEKIGIINYIANYYGFTLADLVSYERKHNEANGEDNKDGNDYNYSWNCGIEGKARRKTILALRKKLMKNAMTFVMLSQGTPFIFSGDEFGNSQNGNNNAYCQDNTISWLNWNDMERNKEHFAFTKFLIALRKTHPILHKEGEMRIMDYLSCGYPDLSYHGENAWYPKFENYNRHIGIMYCGAYAKIDSKKDDAFFYIALNMHWVKQTFGLPKLPDKMKWYLLADTSGGEENSYFSEGSERFVNMKDTNVVIEGRTIKIYIAR